MAAAIVPIAAAIIPSFIPIFVKLIDKIFPSKSGPAKLDVVTEITAAIQAGLVASKGAVGTPLTGDQIKATVQQIVDSLNAAGQLKGAATVIEAPTPATISMADLLSMLAALAKSGGLLVK